MAQFLMYLFCLQNSVKLGTTVVAIPCLYFHVCLKDFLPTFVEAVSELDKVADAGLEEARDQCHKTDFAITQLL